MLVSCEPRLPSSSDHGVLARTSLFSTMDEYRQYRIHIPQDTQPLMPRWSALLQLLRRCTTTISNYGWVNLLMSEGLWSLCPNGTFDQFGNRFWDVNYDFHPQFDVDDDGFVVALAEHLQNRAT